MSVARLKPCTDAAADRVRRDAVAGCRRPLRRARYPPPTAATGPCPGGSRLATPWCLHFPRDPRRRHEQAQEPVFPYLARRSAATRSASRSCAPTTAPSPLSPTNRAPSPSKSGTRRDYLSGSSQALQTREPSPVCRDAAAGRRNTLRRARWPPPTAAAGPHPGGSLSKTPWRLPLPSDLRRRHSQAQELVLSYPARRFLSDPEAPTPVPAPPQTRYPQRQRTPPARFQR